MTSEDAVQARLRDLNESVQDRLARTKFMNQEEYLRTVQCCANCVFYRRSGGQRTENGRTRTWLKQECRRNPPSNGLDGVVWPEPEWNQWCGEHRAMTGFDETSEPEPMRIAGFRQD